MFLWNYNSTAPLKYLGTYKLNTAMLKSNTEPTQLIFVKVIDLSILSSSTMATQLIISQQQISQLCTSGFAS